MIKRRDSADVGRRRERNRTRRLSVLAVLLGMALPLSPVQILWVNLVTALTLSLSLSSEPAEPGIMSRPPRSTKEQILSPRAIAQVL